MRDLNRLPGSIVFRKRLLSLSETFVAQPAAFLKRYRSVFAGLMREPSGEYLLENWPRVLLSSFRPFFLHRLLLKYAGRPCRRWVRQLESYRPALVHAHFGWDGVQAIHLARTMEIPLVVQIHGSDINRQDANPWYVRRRRQLYRQAALFLAVSNYIRRQLIQDGCPPEKIRTHYIGVDIEAWTPTKHPEPGRIVFVGRLVERKGVEVLLRAVARITSQPTMLVIIGEGPERTTLEHLASSSGISVRFSGAQPPPVVRQELARSWVCCVPSLIMPNGAAEGLATVILEAQACSVPVITTPSGGNAEAIIEGQTGFVVPCGDVQALARRLEQILSNPELRYALGQKAHQHVTEKFNLARQTAELENIYDQVITQYRRQKAQKIQSCPA